MPMGYFRATAIASPAKKAVRITEYQMRLTHTKSDGQNAKNGLIASSRTHLPRTKRGSSRQCSRQKL